MANRFSVIALSSLVLACAGAPHLHVPSPFRMFEAAADTPAHPPVQIVVSGIKNARGTVRLSVCSQKSFLKNDCEYEGVAPAQAPETRLTLNDIPPGQYAMQAFVDENDDHKVNRGLFGIPTEPVGFSNDAPIRMAPPSFDAAAVTIGPETGEPIVIPLHYMP